MIEDLEPSIAMIGHLQDFINSVKTNDAVNAAISFQNAFELAWHEIVKTKEYLSEEE